MAPRSSRVVHSDCTLESTALDRERLDRARIVSVVIGVYPCLGTRGAVSRDQEYDVLGPQTPSLEVASERQDESHSTVIDLSVHVRPCSDQDYCFGSIRPRTLKHGVDILVRYVAASGLVRVSLGCDLEIVRAEDIPKLLIPPILLLILLCKYCVGKHTPLPFGLTAPQPHVCMRGRCYARCR